MQELHALPLDLMVPLGSNAKLCDGDRTARARPVGLAPAARDNNDDHWHGGTGHKGKASLMASSVLCRSFTVQIEGQEPVANIEFDSCIHTMFSPSWYDSSGHEGDASIIDSSALFRNSTIRIAGQARIADSESSADINTMPSSQGSDCPKI